MKKAGSDPELNIVSFAVPFPPDYGGAIDIYYKLETLNNLGIKIYLHCFQYGRSDSKILEETNLTASAGIAPNKLLAKIASEWKKPNGQFEICPTIISTFMNTLPLKNIWGLGPKSILKLNAKGIKNCGQLQRLPVLELDRLFGRFGEELYHFCRGLDNRPVIPNRVRKSMSTERTFHVDLETFIQCESELMKLYEVLKRRADEPNTKY